MRHIIAAGLGVGIAAYLLSKEVIVSPLAVAVFVVLLLIVLTACARDPERFARIFSKEFRQSNAFIAALLAIFVAAIAFDRAVGGPTAPAMSLLFLVVLCGTAINLFLPFARADALLIAVLMTYPMLPEADKALQGYLNVQLGRQMRDILVFALLALALNIVVGNTGLLQLGIAAFFAIGAYTAGIFTVSKYPFQIGFWWALALAPVLSAGVAVVLSAPLMRLRGDYLAIVTLGFGEMVRVTFNNMSQITDGPQGLNPIPPPTLPQGVQKLLTRIGFEMDWTGEYRLWFYLALAILVAVVFLLRWIETSRLGRAWLAIREDELAATCMGLNATWVKISAFAISAAIAGVAGVLYAGKLTIAEPSAYDFSQSISVLCVIIIGGLGSIDGALAGAFVLIGFDNVLTPIVSRALQKGGSEESSFFRSFVNYRWLTFGLALVLMMRFRPEGLLPSRRTKEHLGRERIDEEINRVGVE